MSQINQPPVGLQSLLGTKNFGKNPDDLSQIVQPTVDMFPFWASQKIRYIQEQTTTAGAGSTIETIVPDGETWLVLSAAYGTEILTTSDDMNQHVAIDETIAGTQFFVVASKDRLNMVPVGQFYYTVWAPPTPWYLPAGYVIRGINGGFNVSSKDYVLDVIYYRLEI